MRSYNALLGALQDIINAFKYFNNALYLMASSKVLPCILPFESSLIKFYVSVGNASKNISASNFM